MVALPIIIRGGQPEYVAPFWLAAIGWILGVAIKVVVYILIYTARTIRWIWRQVRVAYRHIRR